MPDLVLEQDSFEVPAASGVAGYLKIVGSILELTRVQEVLLTVGKISYKRFKSPDEPEREVETDLSTLMPGAIVRTKAIDEIVPASKNAAVVIAAMFSRVSFDGLNPVAFVSGSASQFWVWHEKTVAVTIRKEEAYGLPFLVDVQIPDDALVLCAAYGRRAAMVDVVKSYKVTIPTRLL